MKKTFTVNWRPIRAVWQVALGITALVLFGWLGMLLVGLAMFDVEFS